MADVSKSLDVLINILIEKNQIPKALSDFKKFHKNLQAQSGLILGKGFSMKGGFSKQSDDLKSYFQWQNTISGKTKDLTGQFKTFSNTNLKTTNSLKVGENVVNALASEYNGLFKVFGMSMPAYRIMSSNVDKFSSKGARFGMNVRNMTHGLRGFRMEMLGVMFFGMGINRFFMGLLQPALQMAGVFDLLSNILGIMFMPIALMMLDWVIKLLDWWESLNEGTQKVIGTMILLGAVLGGILFLIGTLTLGIGSLLVAFSKGGILAWIPPMFNAIGTAISSLGIVAVAIFAVLIAAIIGFVMAWQTNGGQIIQWVTVLWNGIQNAFNGIVNIIKGAWGIIVGIFSGNTTKIKLAWSMLWNGILTLLKGIGEILVGIVLTLGISLYTAFANMVISITKLLSEGFGLLWEKLLVPAYNFGKDIVIKIVEGIKALGSRIAEVILSFLPKKFRTGVSDLFNESTKSAKRVDDFIISGGQVVKTNPLDTIMGFKGTPNGAGVGPITFSPTINISASSNVDIDYLKSQLSSQWRDELDRMIRR